MCDKIQGPWCLSNVGGRCVVPSHLRCSFVLLVWNLYYMYLVPWIRSVSCSSWGRAKTHKKHFDTNAQRIHMLTVSHHVFYGSGVTPACTIPPLFTRGHYQWSCVWPPKWAYISEWPPGGTMCTIPEINHGAAVSFNLLKYTIGCWNW